jgi:hypothetical protein
MYPHQATNPTLISSLDCVAACLYNFSNWVHMWCCSVHQCYFKSCKTVTWGFAIVNQHEQTGMLWEHKVEGCKPYAANFSSPTLLWVCYVNTKLRSCKPYAAIFCWSTLPSPVPFCPLIFWLDSLSLFLCCKTAVFLLENLIVAWLNAII